MSHIRIISLTRDHQVSRSHSSPDLVHKGEPATVQFSCDCGNEWSASKTGLSDGYAKGNFALTQSSMWVKCHSCGTKQTIPKEAYDSL